MKTFIKKLGIFIGYAILTVYILFLILPIIVNPFISSYAKDISKMAEDVCKLRINIEGMKLVTTPKLTAGIRINSVNINLPDGENVMTAENIQTKLSLLPILIKKIEVDVFSVDYIESNLAVKPDGTFLITDYLPEANEDETKEQLTELPLGLKLSNRLPNVYIKEYILSLIDMRTKKTYTLQGNNLKVTDFVLDKRVKFSTAGFVNLDGEKLFNYNIKADNRIMPNVNLNDLVFLKNDSADNTNTTENIPNQNTEVSALFDIFEKVKKNGLTADITLDINISGTPEAPIITGTSDFKKLSLLINEKRLPDSGIKLTSKGKKTYADITLSSAKDEETSVTGYFTHTKNPELELHVISKAKLNNIFTIIKSIATSFNFNDLSTLSATGDIDADFNLKINAKSLKSDGYIRIPDSSVKYGLYNLLIDNIHADIDLADNMVNFKDTGFKILSNPLILKGQINNSAEADLHLTADNLPIKGLLLAAGQVSILKENDIRSGVLSTDISLKGNLNNLVPVMNLDINNINVLNKPSNTGINLDSAKINFSSDGKTYKGLINSGLVNVVNPAAKFSLPKAKITLDEKDINIADTYIQMANSKIDITGNVKNYTSKDLSADIKAQGNIAANDLKQFLPPEIKNLISTKGSMPVLMTVNGNDKKISLKFQLLATPSGYFHITDLSSAAGKSLLINADMDIIGNSISLKNNTGIYTNSLATLPKDTVSPVLGTQLVKVSGGFSDYTKLKVKGLNIATLSEQTISIPTFSKSKAAVLANITLNGNLLSPDIKGSIKISNAEIPSIKTKLKDINLDIAKSINANAPLIMIDNSIMNAKATINTDFSKGIIVDYVDYKANLIDSDTLISAMSGLNTSASGAAATPADIGIIIRTGNADITKFKSGKIVATNLKGDFNLKNNIFYIKNLTGNAFDGKISGNISCNVINGKTDVAMKGEHLNALTAIEAAAAIKNALSGKLDFDTKLNLNAYAPTFNDLLKSVKGTVTFEVRDGHYLNIGTIDQFVLAGNIVSNAVMKAALLPIKTMPVVQSSSNFSTIIGKVNMQNGIATLAPVKSSGKSVAYFVTGQYNILNGYTNVIVLGRMGADVVAVLGPLGQLSVSKIASFLPSFGAKTLNMLSSLTSNPATEKVSEIPALTANSTTYKDFKVIFIGNITNAASVKSFKWLSDCDTSELENASIKGQMQTSVNTIKQSGVNTINDAKKTVEDTKNSIKNSAEDIKNQVQKTKESIEDLKNLKNMFKQKSSEPPQAESSAPAATTESTTESAPAQSTQTSESSSPGTSE